MSSLLHRVIKAHRCRSTHHHIAIDALTLLKHQDGENWRNLLYVLHEDLLEGAKAPDAEFKDFKNHVLHVGDGEWGGARDAALEWYANAVDALKRKKWPEAAWSLGVMSHYYADPIQPFHTGQTEEEGAIHRAVEWSIAKSQNEIAARIESKGYPRVETGSGPAFISEMVLEGARKSHPHYHTLIDHYNVDLGVKDPEAGLDDHLLDVISELVAYATSGLAAIYDRAFEEAGVKAPRTSITLNGFLSTLDIPVRWVAKKLADAHDRRIVEAMYKELKATGKVVKHLPDDDKAIRALHAKQVLRKPLRELNKQELEPLGKKHTPRMAFKALAAEVKEELAARDAAAKPSAIVKPKTNKKAKPQAVREVAAPSAETQVAAAAAVAAAPKQPVKKPEPAKPAPPVAPVEPDTAPPAVAKAAEPPTPPSEPVKVEPEPPVMADKPVEPPRAEAPVEPPVVEETVDEPPEEAPAEAAETLVAEDVMPHELEVPKIDDIEDDIPDTVAPEVEASEEIEEPDETLIDPPEIVEPTSEEDAEAEVISFPSPQAAYDAVEKNPEYWEPKPVEPETSYAAESEAVDEDLASEPTQSAIEQMDDYGEDDAFDDSHAEDEGYESERDDIPFATAEEDTADEADDRNARASREDADYDDDDDEPRITHDDPVRAAPSIGGKTAKRLSKAGIVTIGDLLDADPATVAERVAAKYISADAVTDWQDQTRLMMAMPRLRVHDAQILVGADIRSVDELAEASVRDILDAACNFIKSPAGSQVNSDHEPNPEEVYDWIEQAMDAL